MDTARIDAAKRGEGKYSGKPCQICGNTQRYTTSASCTACVKRYNDRNKLKIRELLKQARDEA